MSDKKDSFDPLLYGLDGKTEKSKKSGKRYSFVSRFFDRFDFYDEAKFFNFLRSVLFIALVFTEVLIFMQVAYQWVKEDNYSQLIAVFAIEMVLTVAEGVKIFVFEEFKHKIALYVIDFLAAVLLIATTLSTYLIVLYILLLTEFYLSAQKKFPSVYIFLVSVPVYLFAYGAVLIWQAGEVVPTLQLLTQSLSAFALLAIHYFFLNFVISFYRQHVNLVAVKAELEESNTALKKANEELATLAVLEERQRIAKDIHDTAGHAITTVIMQTEAAKLIIDSDVSEAKKKVVAANLQAKHALEELRNSVHLLSGSDSKKTLRSALLEIIQSSVDGTGIVFRHDVDDVEIPQSKYRFICNSLKEGVSNGLRHGGATAFYFELKRTEQGIDFLLSDNGKGATVSEIKEGLGLLGMRENAQRLGGYAKYISEEDEGFELCIFLPLSEGEK